MTVHGGAESRQLAEGGGMTDPHPLAPLTPAEIATTVELVRSSSDLSDDHVFVSVDLHEPDKADVLAGRACGREAQVELYDRGRRQVRELVVSLSDRRCIADEEIDGALPPLLREESAAFEAAIKADPRWQRAMRARGIEQLDLVMVDSWPVGAFGLDGGRRLVCGHSFVRTAPSDNGYARPVEGVIAVVDLDTMEVVEVEDHGVVPLPSEPGNYRSDALTPDERSSREREPRPAMRPLTIEQPEGPSFTLDGHLLEWQHWSVRLGFTAREGLVLHDLRYRQGGADRPVIWRASLAEMTVPYGDPGPTHYRKNVFDEGEVGLGRLANGLHLGCDCLGEIAYLDAHMVGADGTVDSIPNAICVHEEDVGIAWKHTDSRTGTAAVRRLRRLVLSFISTLGNYDYAFYWYLYQDGSIEYEVKLTGIISSGAFPVGEDPRFGTPVAPGLYGPNHQHHFCVRLDVAVDGIANAVDEVDSVLLEPGAGNPHGNAWEAVATRLVDERHAQRHTNPGRARFWRVVSCERRNALGRPTAYRLVPGEASPLLQHPSSPNYLRAQYAAKNLWVTRHDPNARFAAGRYPSQHRGGAGLPEYAAAGRPIDGADIVVWYSFGAHHVVRVEDWPVMPVSRAGFHLKPDGFFDRNPAVDLPPPGQADGSCQAQGVPRAAGDHGR